MNKKGSLVVMMGTFMAQCITGTMAHCITGTEEWVKCCGILLVETLILVPNKGVGMGMK